MAASDTAKLVDLYGLAPQYTENTDFLCGVEYEIEAIRKVNCKLDGKFTIHEDNSLRNEGREFVSVPASYETQLKWFDELHDNLVFEYEYGNPYTERTSIHVHVNFKPLVMNKVAQFVKLYILFEPYFFSLVDPKRINSIFCVPLNYTFLPKYYSTNITFQIQKWHKYTAFNILPLTQYGTIEFRHLQGTDNKEIFERWLSTIKKMYDFNVAENVNFLDCLKSRENVRTLMSYIFGDTGFPSELLVDTMLDVKLSGQKLTAGALVARVNKRKGE